MLNAAPYYALLASLTAFSLLFVGATGYAFLTFFRLATKKTSVSQYSFLTLLSVFIVIVYTAFVGWGIALNTWQPGLGIPAQSVWTISNLLFYPLFLPAASIVHAVMLPFVTAAKRHRTSRVARLGLVMIVLALPLVLTSVFAFVSFGRDPQPLPQLILPTVETVAEVGDFAADENANAYEKVEKCIALLRAGTAVPASAPDLAERTCLHWYFWLDNSYQAALFSLPEAVNSYVAPEIYYDKGHVLTAAVVFLYRLFITITAVMFFFRIRQFAANVMGRDAKLYVQYSGDNRADEVKLFRNGELVATWLGDTNPWEVPLDPGRYVLYVKRTYFFIGPAQGQLEIEIEGATEYRYSYHFNYVAWGEPELVHIGPVREPERRLNAEPRFPAPLVHAGSEIPK